MKEGGRSQRLPPTTGTLNKLEITPDQSQGINPKWRVQNHNKIQVHKSSGSQMTPTTLHTRFKQGTQYLLMATHTPNVTQWPRSRCTHSGYSLQSPSHWLSLLTLILKQLRIHHYFIKFNLTLLKKGKSHNKPPWSRDYKYWTSG